MIKNRVKNLFVFIDYLHSKIEHYQSFGGLFSELESLGNNRRNLIPNNYFDKKKLDEINSEIKSKFEVINSEIIQPIKQKATELNICNPEKIETLWNNNISEIENLHNEVNENEVKHIVNQKDKYLHFRLNAPRNLFTQNDFAPVFFDELDEILKELFKDFDEYKKNEFDSLPPNSVDLNLTTFFLKDLKNLEVKTPEQINITGTEIPKQKNKSSFSALEWATIFYYAETTKLLPESRFKSDKMKQFIDNHDVGTTIGNFKNKYHEAERRINKHLDYPIKKLDIILPFLTENYSATVTFVENDIDYLKENMSD